MESPRRDGKHRHVTGKGTFGAKATFFTQTKSQRKARLGCSATRDLVGSMSKQRDHDKLCHVTGGDKKPSRAYAKKYAGLVQLPKTVQSKHELKTGRLFRTLNKWCKKLYGTKGSLSRDGEDALGHILDIGGCDASHGNPTVVGEVNVRILAYLEHLASQYGQLERALSQRCEVSSTITAPKTHSIHEGLPSHPFH